MSVLDTLDRDDRPPNPLCACGCGERLRGPMGTRSDKRYLDATHRKAAWRARRSELIMRVRELALATGPEGTLNASGDARLVLAPAQADWDALAKAEAQVAQSRAHAASWDAAPADADWQIGMPAPRLGPRPTPLDALAPRVAYVRAREPEIFDALGADVVRAEILKAMHAEMDAIAASISVRRRTVLDALIEQDALLARASFDAPWPRSWFTDPGLSSRNPASGAHIAPHVSNDGRIIGHLRSVPAGDDLSRFLTGVVELDDGTTVPVGPIATDAENTSKVLGYVTAGRDRKGRVWIAGGLKPGVDVARAKALIAGVRVDMRPINGVRRFVGLPVGNAIRQAGPHALAASATTLQHDPDLCGRCSAFEAARAYDGPGADRLATFLDAGRREHRAVRVDAPIVAFTAGPRGPVSVHKRRQR
jgi:hypothetical protein